MLGLGASFVASTADWLSGHMLETIKAAHAHQGFSIVHIAQRCPKYNPTAFDFESSDWFQYLTHDNGVSADTKFGPDAKSVVRAKQLLHHVGLSARVQRHLMHIASGERPNPAKPLRIL